MQPTLCHVELWEQNDAFDHAILVAVFLLPSDAHRFVRFGRIRLRSTYVIRDRGVRGTIIVHNAVT